jgi:hypothetical protein
VAAATADTAVTAERGRINALSMEVPLVTSKKRDAAGAVPEFFCLAAGNQLRICWVLWVA